MMNRRRKAMEVLEKRFGRGGKGGHEENEEEVQEDLEQIQQEQEQARSNVTCAVASASHADEENQEEADETNPASALAGAFAVSQQGMVRRGRVRASGDDTSITIVSDLGTVQSDPMPPPPPAQDDGTLLVEAHLAEADDNIEDVREQMATLEQENIRLRSEVPLVQAELAQGIARNKGRRRKCFIILGVTAVLITVAVVVGVSVTGGRGTFPPSTSNSSTVSPTLPPTVHPTAAGSPTSWPVTVAPTQSPTRSPMAVIPADWNPVGQVLHGKAEEDYFGNSVSLSRDGSVMAVGADQASSNSGYVVVQHYHPTTQQWMQIGQELIGQADGDSFGESVSLNGDGTILAIGADENDGGGENAGHVRVFEYTSVSDRWLQLGSDIEGQDTGDEFGFSVSLSDAGDILAVGAPFDNTKNDNNSGSVRLFRYDRGTSFWSQLGQTLIGGARGDNFGVSASLSQSGTIVGVGAHEGDSTGDNAGYASVFEYNAASSRWDLLGDPIKGKVEHGKFGRLVSLDDSGLVMAVVEYGRVMVFAYDRSTSTWNQRGQILVTQQPDDDFGFSVSLSGNGDVLAVGSPGNDVDGLLDAGQVRNFQYKSNTTRWTQVGDPLSGNSEDDRFGSSVSLSADGSVVGVGAWSTNVNDDASGSVYVFTSNN